MEMQRAVKLKGSWKEGEAHVKEEQKIKRRKTTQIKEQKERKRMKKNLRLERKRKKTEAKGGNFHMAEI